MARRGTFKWMVEDYQSYISADLMYNAANAYHPRVQTSEGVRKVPLCTATGNLNSAPAANEKDIHAIGMALTVYLKLMKSLIYFFILSSLCMAPLAYVYYQGEMVDLTNSSIFSQLSLGNVGQGVTRCFQNNLRLFDYVSLKCPAGTQLFDITELGIQKQLTFLRNNVCPRAGSDLQEIDLDLDPECNWEALQQAAAGNYREKINNQFQAKCQGKNHCHLVLDDDHWPHSCHHKNERHYNIRYMQDLQEFKSLTEQGFSTNF